MRTYSRDIPPPGGRNDVMRAHVVSAWTVATGLAVAVAAAGVASHGTVSKVAAASAAPAAMTCAQLGVEAARVSKGGTPELLTVRAPTMVKDNRATYNATYKKKAGEKAALLMACKGTGVWSDGTNTALILQLTVDAKGNQFVVYHE